MWGYNEIMLQDDKKINNIALKVVFIVVIIAIFFVSVSIVNVFKKRKDAESEMKKIKKEKTVLIEKKNEMANLLDYFNDKSFIEKEARRRLNLQKPGEKETIVINDKNNNDQKNSAQANIFGVTDSIKEKSSAQEELNYQNNILYNPLRWFKFIFK